MKSILKAVACSLFAVLISFGVLSNHAWAGNFSQTCYDTYVEGDRLFSNCEKADGYTIEHSSINLDDYIGNIDVSLEWGDHNFGQTCNRIDMVSGNILAANCRRRDQSVASTGIDLDEHISNLNGRLSFE